MRVFEAALAASAAGEPAALCTVIAVNGSAPRSASARMLVFDDGRIVGTIGGGQWEKVVIDAALVCIREGTARRGSRSTRSQPGKRSALSHSSRSS